MESDELRRKELKRQIHNAADAMTEIIDVLRHFATPEQTPWTVDEAMQALEPFGDLAIPALILALQTGDEDLKLLAAQLVREFGPRANRAVGVLIDILRTEDRLLRSVALTALGAIGDNAHVALPLIMQIVEREDELMRVLAARSVIQIDPSKKVVVEPMIRDLLRSDSEIIRADAQSLLAEINGR